MNATADASAKFPTDGYAHRKAVIMPRGTADAIHGGGMETQTHWAGHGNEG